jgi:hypothetical protein
MLGILFIFMFERISIEYQPILYLPYKNGITLAVSLSPTEFLLFSYSPPTHMTVSGLNVVRLFSL